MLRILGYNLISRTCIAQGKVTGLNPRVGCIAKCGSKVSNKGSVPRRNLFSAGLGFSILTKFRPKIRVRKKKPKFKEV